jgi:hypothetical protein
VLDDDFDHDVVRDVARDVDRDVDGDLDLDGSGDVMAAAPAEPRPPMWERWDDPIPVPAPLPVVESPPQPQAPVRVAASANYVDRLDDEDEPVAPRSLYLAALRVHHVRPGILARVLLVEGVLAAAIILVLADLASPWLIAVLPVVVAALVKLHDLVEEGVERSRPTHNSPGGAPGLR